MKQTTAKERVLKNIREALIQKTPQPFPQNDIFSKVFRDDDEELTVLFAKRFTELQGKFIYCENEAEFAQFLTELIQSRNWNHIFCWEKVLQEIFTKHDVRKIRIGKNLDKADVGITLCEHLVSRTGSVVMSTKQTAGRALAIFPPVHIIVAFPNQFVYGVKDSLQLLQEKYGSNMPSMVCVETGPSRTADIEKTLVLGAHGPKEVFLFLIDQL